MFNSFSTHGSISNSLIHTSINISQIVHYQTQFFISNQEILCFAENPLPYQTPEMTINPTNSLYPTKISSLGNEINFFHLDGSFIAISSLLILILIIYLIFKLKFSNPRSNIGSSNNFEEIYQSNHFKEKYLWKSYL